MHPFEVEIDQLKLRGWRRPGSGPRCLAIHGWLDNAGTFSRLVEHLPDWDFLALDLPGHGRSQSLPTPGFYHFIDGVHWVSQLLLHWGADRPLVLLGHSLGGGLASMAAAVCPAQVACLVVLDALGPLTSPVDAAHSLFLRSQASQAKPFHRRYYDSYDKALERLIQEGRSPLAAQALAERSLQCDSNGYYFGYDPRLKNVSRARLTEEQVQVFLRQIACPTQVYSFSGGLMPTFAPLAARLDCLRQGELVEIEGGPHHHLEHPEAVAARMRPFGEAHYG
ncbi:alpha/beta hydrolase [bacterium]|nr:alpha/beta hydrolase [bacterium]